MSWQAFQQEIAEFFRQLGCNAEVEAKVQGARAKHEVDVWVTFSRFGLTQKWAVECKKWSSAIPKEKVMALRAIVEDLGADKGILISERGFQAGAFDAAANTNIALTTWNEFRNVAKNDLYRNLIGQLETTLSQLQARYWNLFLHEYKRIGMNATGTSTLKPGGDSKVCNEIGSCLSLLEWGRKEAITGMFPAIVETRDDGSRILAQNIEEFINLSAPLIQEVETGITEQERAIELYGQASG